VIAMLGDCIWWAARAPEALELLLRAKQVVGAMSRRSE
jgi:hypothetical protein